ncbi:MAG: M1 family metallopeptidase [Cyclobacteriaceae bacterium]
MKKGTATFLFALVWISTLAQSGKWQQAVDYTMNIDMDVSSNQFSGDQVLKYTNNSPDTLFKVYYHLYFNAFQPGSMMDVRSRTIEDPDKRIKDRIFYLKEDEQGWHKILSLTQDGEQANYEVEGTVLELKLPQPILPGQESVFKMKFESQVPLQVRRSGRDNKEGIRFSMSQWFPKMAEYDESGWHSDPYIFREFYSPWGDYQVNIKIDEKYVVAATGTLQNPEMVGHGYDKPGSKGKRGKDGKLLWKFTANNVHDFVWAADPDYVHDVVKSKTGGPTIHYFYQPDTLKKNWKRLPEYVSKAFDFLDSTFTAYPYPHYSIIQGGDGGMEYPMATLITGHRKLSSLVGVSIHEMCHNWLPMMAATNESYLPWIDEGFADYAGKLTMAHLFEKDGPKQPFAYKSHYKAYTDLVSSGKDEPLTTHSDHFSTNKGYSVSSYSKGAVTFYQLGYIIGEEAMLRALRTFFTTWKFRHPEKNDFIRVFERESGLELDWYFDYWINTTSTIDYGIRSVAGENGTSRIMLQRKGEMPMPLDIKVELENGKSQRYYIPLDLMRGEKAVSGKTTILTDWPWVNPFYSFEVPFPLSEIKRIEIDESERLADIDRSDNVYPFNTGLQFEGEVKK